MQSKIRTILIGGLILVVGFSLGQSYNQGQLFRPSKSKIDFNQLNPLIDVLARRYDGQIDRSKLLDGAKSGLVNSVGDPYTTYLDAKSAKELEDDLNGTISGIGAEIGIKNGRLVVIAPVADSPAEKAGLKAQDRILEIDGHDTTGMALDEAVGKIRGAKDTQVKLTISRNNGSPQDLTITRTIVTVSSVKSELKAGQVGYLQISRFGSDTASKLDQAISDLKKRGANRYVIDLRNNPGGYLNTAVDVASQFMSNQVVVDERKGSKVIESFKAKPGGQLVGARLVVLINNGSASASEILAGALQDHGVAKLVGETSYGKGSVQEVVKLAGDAELKVTVAHWYTPKGKNIDKAGIKPDVVVKLEAADYDAGRDPQLDKAIELLK